MNANYNVFLLEILMRTFIYDIQKSDQFNWKLNSVWTYNRKSKLTPCHRDYIIEPYFHFYRETGDIFNLFHLGLPILFSLTWKKSNVCTFFIHRAKQRRANFYCIAPRDFYERYIEVDNFGIFGHILSLLLHFGYWSSFTNAYWFSKISCVSLRILSKSTKQQTFWS